MPDIDNVKDSVFSDAQRFQMLIHLHSFHEDFSSNFGTKTVQVCIKFSMEHLPRVIPDHI